MFYTYKIHKREWNKFKSLVIDKDYSSIELKKEFGLNSKQLWFLFTKLLQNKFNERYERDFVEIEDIKIGQYVYCADTEYLEGAIVELCKNKDLMYVKFNKRKLPTMCSTKGYTVHDDIKRKITNR